jgi:hypothetical protein
MPNSVPEIKAKSVKCDISFKPDFTNATHAYKYDLEAQQASEQFYWDIPNAPKDRVGLTSVIQKGPRHSVEQPLVVTIVPHPESQEKTRLIMKYDPPLKPGDQITLEFDYDAPTSIVFKHKFMLRMTSYVAHFHHQFVIDDFFLQIKLPKRTNVIDSVPAQNGSPRNPGLDPAVAFQRNKVPIDDYFTYHLVFGTARRTILTLYGLGLLMFGFGLGMLIPSRVITKTKQITEVFGSVLLLSGAGIAHHLGDAFLSGSIFGALKRRFGSKSSEK